MNLADRMKAEKAADVERERVAVEGLARKLRWFSGASPLALAGGVDGERPSAALAVTLEHTRRRLGQLAEAGRAVEVDGRWYAPDNAPQNQPVSVPDVFTPAVEAPPMPADFDAKLLKHLRAHPRISNRDLTLAVLGTAEKNATSKVRYALNGLEQGGQVAREREEQPGSPPVDLWFIPAAEAPTATPTEVPPLNEAAPGPSAPPVEEEGPRPAAASDAPPVSPGTALEIEAILDKASVPRFDLSPALTEVRLGVARRVQLLAERSALAIRLAEDLSNENRKLNTELSDTRESLATLNEFLDRIETAAGLDPDGDHSEDELLERVRGRRRPVGDAPRRVWVDSQYGDWRLYLVDLDTEAVVGVIEDEEGMVRWGVPDDEGPASNFSLATGEAWCGNAPTVGAARAAVLACLHELDARALAERCENADAA